MSIDAAAAALVDEAAIRAVLAEYAHRLDAADPRWIETFTPDGIFEVTDAATGQRLHRQEGHGDLARYVARAPTPPPRRQHVVTNPVIDLDGDVVHVESSWQLLERGADGHPVVAAYGRYHDRLVRDDRRWRIAERHAEIDATTRTAGPASVS
jgi:3-phenylpropionate/cinnamic acid dioxygenase small subunit